MSFFPPKFFLSSAVVLKVQTPENMQETWNRKTKRENKAKNGRELVNSLGSHRGQMELNNKKKQSTKQPKRGGFILKFILILFIVLISSLYIFRESLTKSANIGSGYLAKSICSEVFISNRSLENDIIDNEISLLLPFSISRYIFDFHVDYEDKRVDVSVIGGLIGKKEAFFLSESFGCSISHNSSVSRSLRQTLQSISLNNNNNNNDKDKNNNDNLNNNKEDLNNKKKEKKEDKEWPNGNKTNKERVSEKRNKLKNILEIEKIIDKHFQDQNLRTRAMIILFEGEIVIEKYASEYHSPPSSLSIYTSSTPLLGWSMSKSLLSILYAVADYNHILPPINSSFSIPEWNNTYWEINDDPISEQKKIELQGKEKITINDMLNMESGLEFKEVYGSFGDATQMLFLEPDTAHFAALKPFYSFKPSFFDTISDYFYSLLQKIISFIDKNNNNNNNNQNNINENEEKRWSYSSGTTNMLSRYLRSQFSSDEEYWKFPHEKLFQPIGMNNAIIELDQSGTFISSSFTYATARDWTKFGLLVQCKGYWPKSLSTFNDDLSVNAESEYLQIFDSNWIDERVSKFAKGSKGVYSYQWWRGIKGLGDVVVGKKYDWFRAFPDDSIIAFGYDEQLVIIIPSYRIVIARFGLTKDWDRFAFFTELLSQFNSYN